MYDCTNCEFTSESKSGMSSHESMMHDNGTRFYVTAECDQCGEQFERKDSTIEGKDNVFCNRECSDEWRSENQFGENHPGYTKKEVECGYCGDSLKRKKSDRENHEILFCSHDCRWDYFRENDGYEWEEHWNTNRVTVECEWCGDSLYRIESHANYDNHNFCDHDCYGQWRSENIYGEGHPDYKENTRKHYGASWVVARENRIEKDGYECRACGMTREEHKARYGRDLPVHHVIPLRKFDDRETGHSIDNLVTACDACHSRFEGLPVFPA